MQKKLLALAISSMFVGVTGCGGSSSSSDSEETPTENNVTRTTILSDPAVNCESVEITTTSTPIPMSLITDGTYRADSPLQVQQFTSLVATRCEDTVTGANIGSMKSDADFDDETDENTGESFEVATPITTMVEEAVEAGEDRANARTRVANAFGIDEDLIDSQPAYNTDLQKAASLITSIGQMVSDNGGDSAEATKQLSAKIMSDDRTLDEQLDDDNVMNDVLNNSGVSADKIDVIREAVKGVKEKLKEAINVSQAAAVSKIVKEKISSGIAGGTIAADDVNDTVNGELAQMADEAIGIESRVVPVVPPANIDDNTGGDDNIGGDGDDNTPEPDTKDIPNSAFEDMKSVELSDYELMITFNGHIPSNASLAEFNVNNANITTGYSSTNSVTLIMSGLEPGQTYTVNYDGDAVATFTTAADATGTGTGTGTGVGNVVGADI